MNRDILPTEHRFPQAPTASEWDAMSPDERRRVIDSLPNGITEFELQPPEGDPHYFAKVGARDALSDFFRRDPRGVYVGSELVTYYPGEPRFAPDVFVVFDVEPRSRTKWVVSAEGKGLDFVLEVHCGGDRRKDAEKNVARYARVGIPEYFIYDHRRQRVWGYRLESGREYTPVMPQGGRYHSPILGLELGIEEDRLRFYVGSSPLLETPEVLARLREETDRLYERHTIAERERDEAQRERDEAQREREHERSAREAAEQRLAELEAELKRRD